LEAAKANNPDTNPEIIPITGSVNIIINLGLSGIGISASRE
jgi:hypothetical protein